MASRSRSATRICQPGDGWFRQAVVDADVKITGARAVVIRAMERQLNRMTPEELAGDCRASRATVYRLVRLLTEKGVLCRVTRDDGVSYYHASPVRHGQHLVCLRCNRITELEPGQVQAAFVPALAGLGYEELAFRVEASRVCPLCQQSAS